MIYTILETRTMNELIEAVREKIAEGWRPLGGISVHVTGQEEQTEWYAQALTKE